MRQEMKVKESKEKQMMSSNFENMKENLQKDLEKEMASVRSEGEQKLEAFRSKYNEQQKVEGDKFEKQEASKLIYLREQLVERQVQLEQEMKEMNEKEDELQSRRLRLQENEENLAEQTNLRGVNQRHSAEHTEQLTDLFQELERLKMAVKEEAGLLRNLQLQRDTLLKEIAAEGALIYSKGLEHVALRKAKPKTPRSPIHRSQTPRSPSVTSPKEVHINGHLSARSSEEGSGPVLTSGVKVNASMPTSNGGTVSDTTAAKVYDGIPNGFSHVGSNTMFSSTPGPAPKVAWTNVADTNGNTMSPSEYALRLRNTLQRCFQGSNTTLPSQNILNERLGQPQTTMTSKLLEEISKNLEKEEKELQRLSNVSKENGRNLSKVMSRKKKLKSRISKESLQSSKSLASDSESASLDLDSHRSEVDPTLALTSASDLSSDEAKEGGENDGPMSEASSHSSNSDLVESSGSSSKLDQPISDRGDNNQQQLMASLRRINSELGQVLSALSTQDGGASAQVIEPRMPSLLNSTPLSSILHPSGSLPTFVTGTNPRVSFSPLVIPSVSSFDSVIPTSPAWSANGGSDANIFSTPYEPAEVSLRRKWNTYFGGHKAPLPPGASLPTVGTGINYEPVRRRLQVGRSGSVPRSAPSANKPSVEEQLREHREWLRKFRQDIGMASVTSTTWFLKT